MSGLTFIQQARKHLSERPWPKRNQAVSVRIETKLPCPKCGSPNELSLDSSSIAEASWVDCGNCEYRFQKSCDEATLEERWNKLSRKKMPTYAESE